jgi:LacI family transcriptional regulator
MNGRGNVPARIVVHPTHIVIRRSTDVVAVVDKSLAKALRYIRDTSCREELTVADVARHAGISRRLLEKRFRRELGYSVLDEIRRLRTDKMAQLLVETQLPVREIAETLGFGDVQHFARYFRSVKKMSPLGYRKAYAGSSAQQPRSQFGDSYAQSGVVAPRLRLVKSMP